MQLVYREINKMKAGVTRDNLEFPLEVALESEASTSAEQA